MVYKHAVVAAFHILLMKMLLKGEVGDHALNRHGYYIVDHGKSSWSIGKIMELCCDFLCEPCIKILIEIGKIPSNIHKN